MGKRQRVKTKKRKRITGVCVALLCVILCTVTVTAENSEERAGELGQMPEGYQELLGALPEEVESLLPEEIGAEDPETVGKAVEEMAGAEYLLVSVGELAGVELGRALRLFAELCGLLVLAAVFSALRGSFGSDALSNAFRFCTTTAIFAAIISLQIQHLQSVAKYFERLSALMSAMIPITGAVWAMGGNLTTASSGTATLSVFLTVCETLCAKTVLPICVLCTALALCNTLSPDMGLGRFAGAVKKIYTFFLGMIMTILTASLHSTTALTSAADTTAARAAKAVSAGVIPVVGGSVGDTLRTVAAGVQYLKSVVGVGGILFLLMLVLPVLLSLIMTRLAFLLGTGVADLLGCDNESKLLSELGTVWGCMIAVVAMSAVMFILALNIFVKTVVAAG